MTESPLRQRLRDALPAAMKSRDRAAVAVLRSTIAAIDNAEAIIPADDGTRRSLAIEHVPIGAGATEAARRALSESDVERIVRDEIADRAAAAEDYERTGCPDRAEQLRSEIHTLTAFAGGEGGERGQAVGAGSGLEGIPDH
jgi:uncharacterized protein YqeY